MLYRTDERECNLWTQQIEKKNKKTNNDATTTSFNDATFEIDFKILIIHYYIGQMTMRIESQM